LLAGCEPAASEPPKQDGRRRSPTTRARAHAAGTKKSGSERGPDRRSF
jgi:hypothetical protein